MTEVQSEEKQQNPTAIEEKPEKEEKVEKEENGVGEESDGESSEEELGLLERPVEILDRKRNRKTTERLALEKYTTPKTPKEELDFTKGTGVKFGDIAYIKFQLEKTSSEELKPLHRLLFQKVSKVNMIKKNIRTFCGWPFDKESKYYTRVDGQLDKIPVAHLKFICGIIGLEKNGDKLVIKERMLGYLMNPRNIDRAIPGKKGKGEKKTQSKKTPSKSPKTKKEPKSSEEVNDEVSEASDDSGDDEEGKEKEKKAASPKKKTPKKDTPKKKEKKKTPKQAAIKLPVPKKKKASPVKKRKADDDESDDEPLVKKAKGEPSDAELKKVVSTILQDADLEQITMKTVVKQVYDKYPDFDLSQRKDFIKNTVKEIIS